MVRQKEGGGGHTFTHFDCKCNKKCVCFERGKESRFLFVTAKNTIFLTGDVRDKEHIRKKSVKGPILETCGSA